MNLKKIKVLNKENPYKNIAPFIKKEFYSNEKPIIVAKNLKHSFKKNLIYENINFEIFENERVAFLGPNGSGKTLTVSTLCGFIKPKSGKIEYLFDYKKNPGEKLSIQFQDLKFPVSLTPKDLIEFTVKLTNSDHLKDEILEGIYAFEIDKIMNTQMSKLSGGQQQRINVFLSMIGRPKVLFLDEFTTGLDINVKNRLQNYILDFCKRNRISLVIISHDIDSIEEMVDRIIILANKEIMVDAYAKDIIEEFGSVKNMLKKYIVL